MPADGRWDLTRRWKGQGIVSEVIHAPCDGVYPTVQIAVCCA